MKSPNIAPFGSWRSPITADRIVAGNVGLGQIALDRGCVYWTESRPTEGGRVALVRCDADGAVEDVLPAPFSVRTRVHEYGGGAFAVADGTIWFSNDKDQLIYRMDDGGPPAPITQAGSCRYADLVADPQNNRLLAVCEDHAAPDNPANSIVAIAVDGTVQVLADGSDFYAAPRPSPNGSHLLWLSWDHPNMPWDGCVLTRGTLDGVGAVVETEILAGGVDEALFQPEWSPDGDIYFVSDRSGWWNLYRWAGDGAQPISPMQAEVGLPQWIFNMRTYGFSESSQIFAIRTCDGLAELLAISVEEGTTDVIPTPYVEMHGLVADAQRTVFVGSGSLDVPVIAGLDAADRTVAELRRSATDTLDPAVISVAQPVTFDSADGRSAHAFYYPPKNDRFAGPDKALPPLIVKSHGGPTGQSGCGFNLKIQYWTSRGFAVLDVNYGGSTGYGRSYRRALDGAWGVVDVDDCVAGAQWLVAQGLADPNRLAITGGSAGGYTTLCALTFCDVFKAGASHYGIGDLEALARDTHKFESRYLDRLIGKWPDDRAIYEARSPLHHAEGLNCPVIFFQGSEDKVVPPNQAEGMVAALRDKGIPVAYVAFDGEGHGFRQAANIQRALEGELAFYGRVFGFEPSDHIEPLAIDNLP
jgi:dipeptidyl aminopeptidase/acylaminoacyl peptidase